MTRMVTRRKALEKKDLYVPDDVGGDDDELPSVMALIKGEGTGKDTGKDTGAKTN